MTSKHGVGTPDRARRKTRRKHASEHASDPRAQAIGRAAARLDELRRNWLNPADLVDVVPEVVPGFPDRLIPKDERAAGELKK